MGVIGHFLNGRSLVRPGIGDPPPADDSAWLGWVRWFQYAFIAFTLLAVVGAVTASTISREQATIGAVIGLALASWMWFRGQWHKIHSNGDALLYFLVLTILLTAALRAYDGFGLAIFGAYWHGFAIFRIRPAMIYAVIQTIMIQIGFSDAGITSLDEIDIGLPQLLGGVVGLLVAGMMAAYIEGLGREAGRRQYLLDQLRATQDELAIREREAGMAAERQRLAGEIHDTVAQQFTSIVTNLEAAEARSESNPEAARHHILAAREAARQGIADARALVQALQPRILEGRSLAEALGHVADTANLPDQVAVTFREEGRPRQLDRVRETVLVRAMQESLQNARKHAGATATEATLTWLEDEVILDVQDNGVGFEPGAVPAPEGGHRMGLVTMQQRVQNAGGTFMIDSTPGEGTSLAISFHLERERQEPNHA